MLNLKPEDQARVEWALFFSGATSVPDGINPLVSDIIRKNLSGELDFSSEEVLQAYSEAANEEIKKRRADS